MDDKKKNMESIPVFLGLLSSLTLVLSVVYDWGYFMFLGVPFAEAPTSLSDHIKSALIWLPPAAAACFIFIAIEILIQRIERGMTEKEIIESSPLPKVTYYFRQSPGYFFLAGSTFLVGARLYGFPVPLFPLILSINILWIIGSSKLFTPPRLQKKYPTIFRNTFRLIPVVVLFVWYLGYSAAESSVAKNNTTLSLVLTGANENSFPVIPLRSFDKAMLVWHEKTKTYEFVPWQSIYRFSKQHKETKP